MSTFMPCEERGGVVAHMLTHDGTLCHLDKNNRLHREDGPAKVKLSLFPGIEPDVEWWYHGTRIDCKSQEEFNIVMKLKAFW